MKKFFMARPYPLPVKTSKLLGGGGSVSRAERNAVAIGQMLAGPAVWVGTLLM
jgi:hypothetical protein